MTLRPIPKYHTARSDAIGCARGRACARPGPRSAAPAHAPRRRRRARPRRPRRRTRPRRRAPARPHSYRCEPRARHAHRTFTAIHESSAGATVGTTPAQMCARVAHARVMRSSMRCICTPQHKARPRSPHTPHTGVSPRHAHRTAIGFERRRRCRGGNER